MATLIQAYVAYGPKLRRKPTVRLDELSERLSDTTGLRPSQVMMVLLELKASLLHYNRRGAPLELPGIGTFTPSVGGDGRIRMLYRPERSLLGALDNPQTFVGDIENRANAGFTPEDFKALWDAEHPEDPLDLSTLPHAAGPSATNGIAGAGTRGKSRRRQTAVASRRRSPAPVESAANG